MFYQNTTHIYIMMNLQILSINHLENSEKLRSYIPGASRTRTCTIVCYFILLLHCFSEETLRILI